MGVKAVQPKPGKPRKREVKRFTVELSPEEYALLEELAEAFDMRKAEIVRLALRQYFGFALLSLYAPELRELFEIVKRHGKPQRV